jgi:hypothetical protein
MNGIEWFSTSETGRGEQSRNSKRANQTTNSARDRVSHTRIDTGVALALARMPSLPAPSSGPPFQNLFQVALAVQDCDYL